jgi:hypothetical protein
MDAPFGKNNTLPSERKGTDFLREQNLPRLIPIILLMLIDKHLSH